MNVVARKFELLLPVKIATLPKTPGISYGGDLDVISLRSWRRFLVDYNPGFMVCGLKSPDPAGERAILSTFWDRFRQLKPNHELWSIVSKRGIDLSRCCPVALHGGVVS